jgi:hypothetical protein
MNLVIMSHQTPPLLTDSRSGWPEFQRITTTKVRGFYNSQVRQDDYGGLCKHHREVLGLERILDTTTRIERRRMK